MKVALLAHGRTGAAAGALHLAGTAVPAELERRGCRFAVEQSEVIEA